MRAAAAFAQAGRDERLEIGNLFFVHGVHRAMTAVGSEPIRQVKVGIASDRAAAWRRAIRMPMPRQAACRTDEAPGSGPVQCPPLRARRPRLRHRASAAARTEQQHATLELEAATTAFAEACACHRTASFASCGARRGDSRPNWRPRHPYGCIGARPGTSSWPPRLFRPAKHRGCDGRCSTRGRMDRAACRSGRPRTCRRAA